MHRVKFHSEAAVVKTFPVEGARREKHEKRTLQHQKRRRVNKLNVLFFLQEGEEQRETHEKRFLGFLNLRLSLPAWSRFPTTERD